ncbi:hypothetical protein BpHYR1_042921 [Brachionus plicatilis]|uniref:Uncharacterized protein n=1 Tax=Brachionus plicatilis TaxID=10195 RepID=A0A3M7QE43_BRAPC|nr:hypothetical protein BpHYR1_042921 [Brachionus plicatilis]
MGLITDLHDYKTLCIMIKMIFRSLLITFGSKDILKKPLNFNLILQIKKKFLVWIKAKTAKALNGPGAILALYKFIKKVKLLSFLVRRMPSAGNGGDIEYMSDL